MDTSELCGSRFREDFVSDKHGLSLASVEAGSLSREIELSSGLNRFNETSPLILGDLGCLTDSQSSYSGNRYILCSIHQAKSR
jgi:hypothetical protein